MVRPDRKERLYRQHGQPEPASKERNYSAPYVLLLSNVDLLISRAIY